MERNPLELTRHVYDLLIVGGGIYGACVAWDATLRGLSVALVEKSDFAGATSANSLKVIHGGFRYLQHADFKRMRESIRERTTLMRIAPHLIHPLPVVIPTYGHGIQGRQALALALIANDLISFDRNRLDDPQKHIPRGYVIPKRQCLELLPGIPQQGLTGGAVFYDAQVYNSERLVLSFLRSAAQAGAQVANYVEVTGLLQAGDRVTGARVRDTLTGEQFDIRAKMVVNTSGPWINHILGLLDKRPQPSVRFAQAINIITRPLFGHYAVGISSRQNYRDADAVLNKGNRLLFVAPWRGRSLVGTAYSVYDGAPNDFSVSEAAIQSLLDDINMAYPPANLRRDEVTFVHAGLVPLSGVDPKTGSIRLAKHYQLYDQRHSGLRGLISVVGVKYTTARHVAEKVVDNVFEAWGQKPPRSTSAVTRLHDGDMQQFTSFSQAEVEKCPYGLDEGTVRRLIYTYGSAYSRVLRYMDGYGEHGEAIPAQLAVLRAETLYGVHEEMAQKLADVVFRRTELATAGHPGNQALQLCADVMGTALSWDRARRQQELREVNTILNWTSRIEEHDGTAVADSVVQ